MQTRTHTNTHTRHGDVVAKLIHGGASINAETRAGLTPLHVSAIYGKVSI